MKLILVTSIAYTTTYCIFLYCDAVKYNDVLIKSLLYTFIISCFCFVVGS